ncbi:Tyrosine-protein phosphatase [Tolypocladium ophioglossoides CBS 100239]|uniref:Tyrosine-protein phosphatase n=1 Tax=Tolypocladium ophioglossoides (strain CBS 100239) TaxID=1163406 RepID=A0A0L0NHJ2_TOLOC|nr:Tyrosine-protein phosphatase [Tolypocladium ophioglossoides CBS 100239]
MDRTIQLHRVPNFRDVGKTVNSFLGQKRIREGVIYRSARPDEATQEDKRIIRDELGIKTIIDLRTKTELLEQAEKHRRRPNGLVSSESSAAPAHPQRISGIHYQEIKIVGRPFERHLLSQLTWWSFIKVVFLFIFGYRMDAVRIISQEVLLPRGLVGLGTDTLDHSGAEVCAALSLYTSAQSIPVLLHCTRGKDRTGLVCALILMALNVPLPAIEHDYCLTDAALLPEPERDERLAELRGIGLTDAWASTAEDMISGMEKHLAQKYGGLDAYLDTIGFGEADRAMLCEALLY